jgi:putative ABC transport system substrate-binding protein
MATELSAKRLGLLHELVPSAERFAALMQPNEPQTEAVTADLKAAAQSIRKPIDIIYANSGGEIDAAYASLPQKRVGGLLISPSSNLLFQNRRTQLAVLSVRFGVPVIYPVRVYAEAGGLMSYGSSSSDTYRQVGLYTARILKGEKPADLPVMRPVRFEFIINLHTAKTQGFTVPPTLLAQADEVIE